MRGDIVTTDYERGLAEGREDGYRKCLSENEFVTAMQVASEDDIFHSGEIQGWETSQEIYKCLARCYELSNDTVSAEVLDHIRVFLRHCSYDDAKNMKMFLEGYERGCRDRQAEEVSEE